MIANVYICFVALPWQKYYHPLKSPEKNHLVTNALLHDIFFQIPQILAHHEAFLEDLKLRLETWEGKATIGDWFLKSVSSQGWETFSTCRKTSFVGSSKDGDPTFGALSCTVLCLI